MLAILACWLNSLPLPLKVAATGLCLISWVVQYRACRTDTVYLRYSPTDAWTISVDGNRFDAIKLKPNTVISTPLTVLQFKVLTTHKSLLIFSDAMPADQYRKLIVQLKISGLTFD